jgi:hypothetical protein
MARKWGDDMMKNLWLKTKVDCLSVVWHQNRWDGVLVIWPKNHWVSFSQFGHKTGGDGFSCFGLKTGGLGFPGLDLKTGSYGLMIWAAKSPLQFLGLILKTKQTLVCQMCQKTDGRMKMTHDMCWDLAACFSRKQVRIEFPSLASRLAEIRRCMMHVVPLRRSCEDQVKDGRVDVTGCVGLYSL